MDVHLILRHCMAMNGLCEAFGANKPHPSNARTRGRPSAPRCAWSPCDTSSPPGPWWPPGATVDASCTWGHRRRRRPLLAHTKRVTRVLAMWQSAQWAAMMQARLPRRSGDGFEAYRVPDGMVLGMV